MNSFFFRLCWKNVWRNKRRTLITVNAIAIGVTALIWLHNYYDAFHEQLVQNAIRFQSGHALISLPSFLDNRSPQDLIANPSPLYEWIVKQKEVRTFSPTILIQGLLSSPRGSANIWLKGIDPRFESRTTKFAEHTISGNFFARFKGKPILIGSQLANLLKVTVGSRLVVLTQGIDGSIGNDLFRVTGIFQTKSDLDKHLAFILLKDARLLSGMGKNSIHQISIVLNQDSDAVNVKNSFLKSFKETPFQLFSWKEVQKNLVTIIELNRTSNRIIMIVILFIAAMGIANSILMGILERTREFGVMLAMGSTKNEVIRLVVLETLLLALVGVLLGNVLGIGITSYFHHTGFDLGWLTPNSLVVNGAVVQTVSYPDNHWMNNLTVTSVVCLLSFVASFIPVRHVSKLDPVKALRAN